jgi:hypothetical protein
MELCLIGSTNLTLGGALSILSILTNQSNIAILNI